MGVLVSRGMFYIVYILGRRTDRHVFSPLLHPPVQVRLASENISGHDRKIRGHYAGDGAIAQHSGTAVAYLCLQSACTRRMMHGLAIAAIDAQRSQDHDRPFHHVPRRPNCPCRHHAILPCKLTMKVSDKGALSVYGLGRFPVTLYRGQWERLATHMDDITAFITANAATLTVKA